MWRWGLVILAIAGVSIGIVMVFVTQQEPTPAKPLVTPDPVPYQNYIAGSGIIEASSDDIIIATPLSGVVDVVYVGDGEQVEEGAALFRLDDREYQAQLRLRLAELDKAMSQVVEAQRNLEDRANKLRIVENLSDKRAISQEEVDNRRNALRLAEAQLLTAEAEVMRQQAQTEVIETDLERVTVRSPIAGEILQVNIHGGEFAQAGLLEQPLMVVGATDPLHVRVDLDENDAWKFQPGAAAIAVPRGVPWIQIPLTFVSIEPYVVPKRSLTGDVAERVDTRVLQVIYSFQKEDYPVYVGQQVDVFVTIPQGESEEEPPTTSTDTATL